MKSLRCGDKKLLDIATSISSNEEGVVSGALVDEYITKRMLEAIPVGTILMFWSSTVPAGFLRCDGAYYSKYSYPRLYATRDTAWPQSGDLFAVPDFIARYPRGYGWEGVGVYMEDAIRNIYGQLGAAGAAAWGGGTGALYLAGDMAGTPNQAGSERQPTGLQLDASRVVPTAGENRPRSLVVHFCIKY